LIHPFHKEMDPMTDLSVPVPDTTTDPPTVVDAELVDLDALTRQPLAYLPVLATCRCGNVTDRGHGLIPGRRRAFRCDEVLAIRRRVEAHAEQPRRASRLLFRRIRGGA
jgi:hypothetical protein